MNIIDIINQNVDPFTMQLIIVPVISILIGVLVAVYTKAILFAPIVTLLVNLVYEHYFLGLFENRIYISEWSIIFPLISLMISIVIFYSLKNKTLKN